MAHVPEVDETSPFAKGATGTQEDLRPLREGGTGVPMDLTLYPTEVLVQAGVETLLRDLAFFKGRVEQLEWEIQERASDGDLKKRVGELESALARISVLTANIEMGWKEDLPEEVRDILSRLSKLAREAVDVGSST